MGAYEDAQIKTIIQALEETAEKVVIRLGLNITSNLIEDTPIDTGWARANWVPAIGASRASPAASQPTGSQVQIQQALQQSGMVGLLSYKLASGTVFISNNVPYIGRLNDGSSTQAPSGFVQAAIRRGVQQTEADLK
ncbi:hypothetical protein [Roseobacter phage RDJL6]|nr:hypothetical protein [Roseobacter phage RDJL6]